MLWAMKSNRIVGGYGGYSPVIGLPAVQVEAAIFVCQITAKDMVVKHLGEACHTFVRAGGPVCRGEQ
jgi:hypothetical protein